MNESIEQQIAAAKHCMGCMHEGFIFMEERLVQSERLATIGRFASQIAHEIRNPLSSISLNVELLAERVYIFDSITSMTIRKTPTILAVEDDTWSTIFNP